MNAKQDRGMTDGCGCRDKIRRHQHVHMRTVGITVSLTLLPGFRGTENRAAPSATTRLGGIGAARFEVETRTTSSAPSSSTAAAATCVFGRRALEISIIRFVCPGGHISWSVSSTKKKRGREGRRDDLRYGGRPGCTSRCPLPLSSSFCLFGADGGPAFGFRTRGVWYLGY